MPNNNGPFFAGPGMAQKPCLVWMASPLGRQAQVASGLAFLVTLAGAVVLRSRHAYSGHRGGGRKGLRPQSVVMAVVTIL